MRISTFIACLACSLLPAVAQVDIDTLPKPTGYVSDLAHVISADDKAQLETLCTDVDRQLGAQFAIVTLPKIGDENPGDIALDIGRKWGVGPKGDRQGLVILISLDHHARIQVGRQLEPYITDGFAGDTRRAMIPDLRAGNFGAALTGAVNTLAAHLAEQKNAAFSPSVQIRPARPRPSSGSHFPGWLVFLFILFIFFWLIGRGRRGPPRMGYPPPRQSGAGDFLTGMLIGSMLDGSRGGGSDWRPPDNDPGGGFGGGDSGGGFGGFGGGGDFGGGGSSGDW